MHKCKLIPFSTDDDGNKIFCFFIIDKKKVFKGYYDFDKERFFIIRRIKDSNIEGLTKKDTVELLKETLLIEHDWILWENHLKKYYKLRKVNRRI